MWKHNSIKVALILVLLLAVVPGSRAGDIVVVFNIEAQRLDLQPSLLAAMSDYLASRLTETGVFQVIPRSELKKRLESQKRDSYRECYDQACQIELGRELAAEKTIHTQIIRIGSTCNLTSTLYDLKKAATQAAATTAGGCDEDGIMKSLNKVVADLVENLKGTPTPDVTPAATAPKNIIEESKPVEVRKPYHKLDTEWVDLDLVVGYHLVEGIIFGGDLRFPTLKWDHFHWTVLQAGFYSGDSISAFYKVGTRPGFPLYLDEEGRHSLRFNLGVEFIYLDDYGCVNSNSDCEEYADAFSGLFVSPGISYVFQSPSGFRVGLEVRASVYLVGDNNRDYLPVFITTAIPISWHF